MSSKLQKNQAQIIQVRLKELGFDAKLGHGYQVIAAIAGEKSWNDLSGKIKKKEVSTKPQLPYFIPGSVDLRKNKDRPSYRVTLQVPVLSSLDLEIEASSYEEASKKVDTYLHDDQHNLNCIDDYLLDLWVAIETRGDTPQKVAIVKETGDDFDNYIFRGSFEHPIFDKHLMILDDPKKYLDQILKFIEEQKKVLSSKFYSFVTELVKKGGSLSIIAGIQISHFLVYTLLKDKKIKVEVLNEKEKFWVLGSFSDKELGELDQDDLPDLLS